MLGKYLARTQGAAKVAVLFQNDDYGKDLLNGLKKGIQRSKCQDRRSRAVRGDGRDVQSQIAKLQSVGRDTFAVFATPKFAIQAYVIASKLGWKPKLC